MNGLKLLCCKYDVLLISPVLLSLTALTYGFNYQTLKLRFFLLIVEITYFNNFSVVCLQYLSIFIIVLEVNYKISGI